MAKRIIALCSAFVFTFIALIGRCAYISFGKAYQVGDSYNSITLNIGSLYTNIYDRKGSRLNNNSKSYVAVIRPNEKCLRELERLYTPDEIKNITDELSKGYPIIRPVSRSLQTEHIKIYQKTENDIILARHLLSKSTGGLEAYVSKQIGSLSVNFTIDALGRLLAGDEGSVLDNNYDSAEGIVISLDKDLQEIAENAAVNLKKGAVTILDCTTSQVLASVSKGDDYVNRALASYAVGSVFKLVVCACAIENNINLIYDCKSSIKVGDITFSCQKNHTHGVQDMKGALANSCNCYFVELALKLGAERLYKTATSFGFGMPYELYDGWQLKSGEFADMDILSSKGQLALVGFGQGKLTDSPMHFASVVACIANGGKYLPPTLDINNNSGEQIISKKTAERLRSYMHYVVTNGTGSNANYNGITAGKTATAQSGIYNNGTEVLNTWFAGFYPINEPKYAIVVLCEDGKSGAEDCCPIFRTIVESIEKM